MAEQKAEQEPSMEDILASIRRIIAEEDEVDEQAVEAPSRDTQFDEPGLDDEVLEITDEDDELVEAPSSAASTHNGGTHADGPVPTRNEKSGESERRPKQDEDSIVSAPVADATAGAFGALLTNIMVASRNSPGVTLDDLVREMLKPMLREWLDANLESIVRASVAEEIDRIIARARR